MDDAYLAGLIDGEGSIMLLGQGPKRSRAPEIAVAITEEHVLEAVKEAYGGFIRRPTGSVPQWRLKGQPALEVLRAVRPFLVIRRRRALADLLWRDPIITRDDIRGGVGKVHHNEMVFQKMRARNAERLTEPPQFTPTAPSRHDFAYLAGILDGEGSINGRRIEVYSTDPELPAWIESRFGGSVYAYKSRRPGQRDQWAWKRSATGCQWAEGVADVMLLDRKSDKLRELHDFRRRAPTPRYTLPHKGDAEYLRLRGRGVLPTPAAREAGLPVARARFLETQ